MPVMKLGALILSTTVALASHAATEITPGDGPVYQDEARALRFDGDGSFALDAVFFDERNSRDSELRLDRALLGGTASWRDFVQARAMFDAGGTDTRSGVDEATRAPSRNVGTIEKWLMSGNGTSMPPRNASALSVSCSTK